jgi:hypothetical protein
MSGYYGSYDPAYHSLADSYDTGYNFGQIRGKHHANEAAANLYLQVWISKWKQLCNMDHVKRDGFLAGFVDGFWDTFEGRI